jgi:hypothetical protein
MARHRDSARPMPALLSAEAGHDAAGRAQVLLTDLLTAQSETGRDSVGGRRRSAAGHPGQRDDRARPRWRDARRLSHNPAMARPIGRLSPARCGQPHPAASAQAFSHHGAYGSQQGSQCHPTAPRRRPTGPRCSRRLGLPVRRTQTLPDLSGLLRTKRRSWLGRLRTTG